MLPEAASPLPKAMKWRILLAMPLREYRVRPSSLIIFDKPGNKAFPL
jgi:hypothetical protein